MRRKLSFALVVVLAGLIGASPAAAAGSKTFTDPAGDGSAGPDITQLVVSNDDNGQLTFAFTYSNRPTILTGDDIVALGIDADRRGNTGDPAGYEFIFGFLFEGGGQVEVGQWDGSRFNFDAPQTTLRATEGGRTITINRSELGNTAAFDFRVVTQGNGPGDTAPEGGGVWTYELQIQQAPPAPQITGIRAAFSLAQPRAGKPFAVTRTQLRLSDGKDVAPTAVTCRATLGGKPLPLRGRCRWNVPRNTRGKQLMIFITASFGGATARFEPYVFRVRA